MKPRSAVLPKTKGKFLTVLFILKVTSEPKFPLLREIHTIIVIASNIIGSDRIWPPTLFSIESRWRFENSVHCRPRTV